MKAIHDQYERLKTLNAENFRQLVETRKEFAKEVRKYEKLQSDLISEEVKKLAAVAKKLFPEYKIYLREFGIRIASTKGISRDGYEAENENSGLGSWNVNPSISKVLSDAMGPNVIKKTSEDIAWFEADKNSEFDDKTSWVYTMIKFEFKKPYLNTKFEFKTAPKSKV